MFEDSLVESSGVLRRRNPWTAALSFSAQGLIAVALVLLPLVYTKALPWRQITAIVNAPPPPPPASPPAPNRLRTAQSRPATDDGVIRVPSTIPNRVAMVHDEETQGADSTGPDLVQAFPVEPDLARRTP